ncbi:conserved protein of unknown function [Candidatus Filomicrobium marinum]|uniref:Uncharacterized protein n=1 Tax=Candidatus Filomicrobium marinum TaxID=1608628 RepID=A0A0D6JC75_9HYPH|nr:hypothetical protein [Candidatus Filomicrobium marinum]CFX04596.1 conserved protein of unknown function [Candidatus Filomicrobium marinum]CPR16090.1 conserved protein of unknown function [Candidatus Filomicrobium marinum]
MDFPEDAYGPEAVAVMGRAFEQAWQELNAITMDLPYSAHVVRRRIALRILEAAQDGERDPQRLKELALRGLEPSPAD